MYITGCDARRYVLYVTQAISGSLISLTLPSSILRPRHACTYARPLSQQAAACLVATPARRGAGSSVGLPTLSSPTQSAGTELAAQATRPMPQATAASFVRAAANSLSSAGGTRFDACRYVLDDRRHSGSTPRRWKRQVHDASIDLPDMMRAYSGAQRNSFPRQTAEAGQSANLTFSGPVRSHCVDGEGPGPLS